MSLSGNRASLEQGREGTSQPARPRSREAKARRCGKAVFSHSLLENFERVLLDRVLSGKSGRAGSGGLRQLLPSSAPSFLKKVELAPPCSGKSSKGELAIAVVEGSVLCSDSAERWMADRASSERCMTHLPWPGLSKKDRLCS
ncbi:hypothetical protein L7F22_040694 [Adiantum nelumboides]|nr:hypothetical protein [Adiantum nelumboides]